MQISSVKSITFFSSSLLYTYLQVHLLLLLQEEFEWQKLLCHSILVREHESVPVHHFGGQFLVPRHVSNDQHIFRLKLTFCTSPASANLLPTSFPSSGRLFQAKRRGAVARPSSRSAPAGFPSSVPLIV